LLADNYTPSRCNGAADQRQIKDAVFLFVTVVPDNQRSQKRSQLRRLEQTIIEKLDFHKLAIRTVKFCIGNSDADAVQQCKNAIDELFRCNSGSLTPGIRRDELTLTGRRSANVEQSGWSATNTTATQATCAPHRVLLR
jgi:hypothetical protein